MYKYMFYLINVIKFQKAKYPISPYKLLKLLTKSEFLSRETIEKRQIEQLNKLLAQAIKSAYFKSLYQNITLPIKSKNEIRSIPVILKDDLREDNKKFIIGSTKGSVIAHTSGTTGNPSEALISPMAIAYRRALTWRFRKWWGILPHEKYISFTGFPQDTSKLRSKILYRLNPRLDINIFKINSNSTKETYLKIRKYKPTYIRGYKSVIVQFSKYLRENKIDASELRLKVVIVTSELLYEFERTLIEETFNCKVANEYGAVEAGLIAFECPNGGMHIQEEAVLCFTDTDSELVSTELFNNTSLLINYKVGDKVVISDEICSCGRTSRLIKNIIGRIGSDEIHTLDGRRINYLFFDIMIIELFETKFWGQIDNFQIIQIDYTLFFHIVKGREYSLELEEHITKYIKKGLGQDMVVKFVYHDEIKKEKSGKFRIFKRIGSN